MAGVDGNRRDTGGFHFSIADPFFYRKENTTYQSYSVPVVQPKKMRLLSVMGNHD